MQAIPATQLLLGTPLLQNREAILDWNDRKICLGPIHGTPKPDRSIRNMGLSIDLEDQVLKVVFLWQGSAADKAGILLGDEVIAINGMDTRHATRDIFCAVECMVGGTEMEVTVRHASGAELKCKLAEETLIR